MKKFDKTVILIPAYEPDKKLLKLIDELKRATFNKIVVVNDGSKEKYSDIFNKVVERGVPVIHHKTNRGKGSALKSGMKYIMKNYDKYIGVITVDADGQHSVWDVKTVALALIKNKEKFILGVRDFHNENVPTRSKISNLFSRSMFQLITKENIADTQTGLRAIPTKLLPLLVKVAGERFDYETNVLFTLHKKKIKIEQVQIMTNYFDKNKGSHFKTWSDGTNVAKVFIKNMFKR